MDISAIINLIQENGPWALTVIAGFAYWHEKKAHDGSKEKERTRLLEELNYLNRVRDGERNV